MDHGDPAEAELAVRRILLMHGLIMTLGGIPLIYLGDEIAQLNDYGYRDERANAADGRWLHRPRFASARLAQAEAEPGSPQGRVHAGIAHLATLRRNHAALGGSDMQVIELDERYLVAFVRRGAHEALLVVGNLSEHEVAVPAPRLRRFTAAATLDELVGGRAISLSDGLNVAPYAFMVLRASVSDARQRPCHERNIGKSAAVSSPHGAATSVEGAR